MMILLVHSRCSKLVSVFFLSSVLYACRMYDIIGSFAESSTNPISSGEREKSCRREERNSFMMEVAGQMFLIYGDTFDF
jgi:hypothetical protein